jgi:hypothetical protein
MQYLQVEILHFISEIILLLPVCKYHFKRATDSQEKEGPASRPRLQDIGPGLAGTCKDLFLFEAFFYFKDYEVV